MPSSFHSLAVCFLASSLCSFAFLIALRSSSLVIFTILDCVNCYICKYSDIILNGKNLHIKKNYFQQAKRILPVKLRQKSRVFLPRITKHLRACDNLQGIPHSARATIYTFPFLVWRFTIPSEERVRVSILGVVPRMAAGYFFFKERKISVAERGYSVSSEAV